MGRCLPVVSTVLEARHILGGAQPPEEVAAGQICRPISAPPPIPASKIALTFPDVTSVEEKLPRDAFKSFAALIVVSREGELLSEHQTTPDAVRALAKYSAQHGEESGAIYRRTSSDWVKY
jgi:hypothetical protein